VFLKKRGVAPPPEAPAFILGAPTATPGAGPVKVTLSAGAQGLGYNDALRHASFTCVTRTLAFIVASTGAPATRLGTKC